MSVETLTIQVSDLDPLDAELLPQGTTHLQVEFEYDAPEPEGILTPPSRENWGILEITAMPSQTSVTKLLARPEAIGIRRECEHSVDAHICDAKHISDQQCEDE